MQIYFSPRFLSNVCSTEEDIKTNIIVLKMKLSNTVVLAFAASDPASAFAPAFLPNNPETRLFVALPQGG
jgi:hypothetical protein